MCDIHKFHEACTDGDLDAVHALAPEVFPRGHDFLLQTCENGHIDVMIFLSEKYPKYMTPITRNVCFMTATKQDDTNMLEWLYDTMDNKYMVDVISAFTLAHVFVKPNSCNWLREKYGGEYDFDTLIESIGGHAEAIADKLNDLVPGGFIPKVPEIPEIPDLPPVGMLF